MPQRGFSGIPLIITSFILVGGIVGGSYYLGTIRSTSQSALEQTSPIPTKTRSATPTSYTQYTPSPIPPSVDNLISQAINKCTIISHFSSHDGTQSFILKGGGNIDLGSISSTEIEAQKNLVYQKCGYRVQSAIE
jgi:hypothetical protein